LLGLSYLSCDKLAEAEDALQQVIDYSEKFDTELIKSPANTLLGVISISKGKLSQGLKMLKTAQKEYLESNRRYAYATSEDILGKVYLKIVEGAPVSLAMIKNFGFLLKHVPFASRKAEQHFNKSILVAKEIGAKSTLGIAYLDLALIHRKKDRNSRARGCVLKAIEVLEQCDAEVFLKQAREILTSLK
jgi:tetratricopeptide (TPR) repeat protein